MSILTLVAGLLLIPQLVWACPADIISRALPGGNRSGSIGETATGKEIVPAITVKSEIRLRQCYMEDGWDVERLDTARTASYLTDFEKNVILAMNMVRSNPAKYAVLYVREIKNYYSGYLLEYPGETAIATQEGELAADILYAVLIHTKPAGLLVPARGLSLAARFHASEQSMTGFIGHGSADGSSPYRRIKRFGEVKGRMGENIAYGSVSSLQAVTYLLIDDGVEDRNHRRNILEDKYRFTGAANGFHPIYNRVTVITYAEYFVDSRERKSGKDGRKRAPKLNWKPLTGSP